MLWVCSVCSIYNFTFKLQEPKLYEEVGSIEEMTEVVTSGLEEYNNTHKNRMNLVVFR